MENQEVNLSKEVKVTKQTKTLKLARGCALSAVLFCVLSVIIATIFSDDEDEKTNVTTTKIEDNKAYLDSIKKICIPMYKEEISIILKSVTSEYDDFENITWYYHKNQPKYSNTNAFYISVFSKDNNFGGRLIVRYSGDDWLFIKRIIVKCDDRKFLLNTDKVNRDNASGSVWEWVDIPIDKSVEDVIAFIIASNNSKIRFEGDQYSYDYTLSPKEKKALIDMYNFIRYNNEIVLLEAK